MKRLGKRGERSLGGFLDVGGGSGTLAITVAGVIDEEKTVARVGGRIEEIEPVKGEGAVAGEEDPEFSEGQCAGRKVECLLPALRGCVTERDEGGIAISRRGRVRAGVIDEVALE